MPRPEFLLGILDVAPESLRDEKGRCAVSEETSYSHEPVETCEANSLQSVQSCTVKYSQQSSVESKSDSTMPRVRVQNLDGEETLVSVQGSITHKKRSRCKRKIIPESEIRLIRETLDTYEWEANYKDDSEYSPPMFNLARKLMAYPSLRLKSPDEAADFIESLIDWQDLPGIDDDETGRDQFIGCWQAITNPHKLGKEAFVIAMQKVEEFGMIPVRRPAGKVTSRFTHAVNICYRLQQVEDEAPIALACRAFGDMMGVHYTDAAMYLSRMVNEGFLEIVEPARKLMQRATRYRFIGKEINGELLPGAGTGSLKECATRRLKGSTATPPATHWLEKAEAEPNTFDRHKLPRPH